MIFKKLTVQNFQSYRSLELNLSHLGLTSIVGATGAGKSTVMDAIFWTLFGETGKESKSDSVRPWLYSDEDTVCSIDVDGTIITRTRGKRNDLTIGGHRGVNLTDTQKMIDNFLGVNSEKFQVLAYLNQFSKLDSFFIASAKERRAVLDTIVNFDLPNRVSEAAKAVVKKLKVDITALETDTTYKKGAVSSLQSSLKTIVAQRDKFDEEKRKKISVLSKELREKELQLKNWQESIDAQVVKCKSDMFTDAQLTEVTNDIKAKEHEISSLHMSKCPTCGEQTAADKKRRDTAAKELKQLQNKYQEMVNENHILAREIYNLNRANPPVAADDSKLIDAMQAVNPFEEQIEETTGKIAAIKAALRDLDKAKLELQADLSDHKLLDDKSLELRGVLLKNAVQQLQQTTNKLLSSYFDAKIKLKLFIESDDKLEAEIEVEGLPASFRQLSGGERCMVKLCFSVAQMKLCEESLTSAINICLLDEPFNGLDSKLKMRAVAMVEESLNSRATILLIDHSPEVASAASTTLTVVKHGDVSHVE